MNLSEHDNEVHLQHNNGRRLKFCMYVDTAAAKSVMCTEMKNAIVEECVRRNWPYRVVEENEPFRFGPGKRIWSKQALIIAANWGGVVVILRLSVIDHSIPTLLSKHVFRRLGAIIDLSENVLRLIGFYEAVEPLHDLRTTHNAIFF